jgi:hypothetical protein
LWDQPDDTAKSVVVKTELKRIVEERSMTAEQTSGDDDNKVESEFHWLSDLGMNNNHTAMSLAVTRPTAG